MTDQDWEVLIGFLTGGSLVGIIGRWLDLLVAIVKGR